MIYVTLAYRISDVDFLETCFMCHFYRVESQLYRDGKSRNLRRKMTKLWHFEPTRGEK